MKSEEELRRVRDVELAEHAASQAEEMMAIAKSRINDVIIKTVALDPTVDDIASLKAQVSLAIMLVIQANAVVESTDMIVSHANRAVDILRKIYGNG